MNKKKKEIFNIVKNGLDFKLIVSRGKNGNILNVMEKPNVRTWTQSDFNIATSGAHVFANPEFNHCDFFQSGALVFREYPEVRGSTDYGYTISGARIII